MADINVKVSKVPDLLVDDNLKLSAASRGAIYDTSASISGAAGTIDFAGNSILRLTVTGNLTGSFTWPPVNFPALAADAQSIVLSIAFLQDATGGRVISLPTLFENAGEANIYGVPLVDEAPGGVTVVDIIARRVSGTVGYTVLFSPGIDASQIITGSIPVNILPAATTSTSGVVTLAAGSTGAAAGDHVHHMPLVSRVTLKGEGTNITTGDYELLDMPSAGVITRLTGFILVGTGTPTATLSAKISGATVTGTGTSANATAASTDSNATAANVFVARQKLQLAVTVTAGTVSMITGYIHYTMISNPWVP